MVVEENRAAFNVALRTAREGLGWSREYLAERLAEIMGGEPYTHVALAWWEKSTSRTPPTPPVVFGLEQALGTRPGHLSRHLGYLPATTIKVRDIFDAVDYEPRLTQREKDAVKALLRGLVDKPLDQMPPADEPPTVRSQPSDG